MTAAAFWVRYATTWGIGLSRMVAARKDSAVAALC